MRTATLPLPELGLIAGTRAMLGAGVALLVADKLGHDQRRAIGWTLAAVGALTTIPIVMLLAAASREPVRRRVTRRFEHPLPSRELSSEEAVRAVMR